jgi:hypothetical protein
MDLLKRAASRARDLRAQCLSVRAARLAGALRMFERHFQRQPEMPACLAGINAALDDLSPLPAKIALQRKETLQREAGALEAILQKAAPFVPLLDASEPNFRKSITILSKSERVPLDIDRSFSSDVRLVLYEDGRLTRALRFRETCTRGFGWEQEEEEDLNYASAVSLYGLDAIASGLAAALEELPAVRTVHRDLEERLRVMTKILEALQRTP